MHICILIEEIDHGTQILHLFVEFSLNLVSLFYIEKWASGISLLVSLSKFMAICVDINAYINISNFQHHSIGLRSFVLYISMAFTIRNSIAWDLLVHFFNIPLTLGSLQKHNSGCYFMWFIKDFIWNSLCNKRFTVPLNYRSQFTFKINVSPITWDRTQNDRFLTCSNNFIQIIVAILFSIVSQ